MSLTALERRTSPENPSTSLANPAAWLSSAFGALPTWAGNTVTERTSLTYAAAFACINVLSKDLAQLPCNVYKRNGEERTIARDTDVYRVMHDRPNPMMTPFTFKQTLQAHAVSWGNGYAEIEYDNRGRVLHLWPLLPDRTRIVVKNGKKWFVTRVDDSRTNSDLNDGPSGGLAGASQNGSVSEPKYVGLSSDQVLHVPGLGFDGLKGYSVIRMARQAIGAGIAAEQFTAQFFSNSATPRLALKHPGKLSNEAQDRLRIQFEAATSGLSNAHRSMILAEGMEVEKLGLPAKDAELLESSKFGIEQMARFFDIPLMRLHSTTGITSWGTGLEQWQRAYLTHTLGPWLVQWEEAINYSCFTDAERPVYYAEFLREALLQADHAARGQFYREMFGIGAISPNEIARKENLPQGPSEGDERFVPLNYVPLSLAVQLLQDQTKLGGGTDGKTPDGTVPPKTPPEKKAIAPGEIRRGGAVFRLRAQNAHQRILKQAAERVTTKQVQRAQRAVERLQKDGNTPGFITWARDFFQEERPAIRDAFLPAVLSLAEMIAGEVQSEIGGAQSTPPDVQRFVGEYVDAMAIRQSVTSAGQLITIAQSGEPPESVIASLNDRLAEWSATRPASIARHEASQSGNAVARHVYELGGVRKLRWMAMSDQECELCAAMDGTVVGIERPFLADGETVRGETKSLTADGTISHPPLHRGCDCQLVAA